MITLKHIHQKLKTIKILNSIKDLFNNHLLMKIVFCKKNLSLTVSYYLFIKIAI